MAKANRNTPPQNEGLYNALTLLFLILTAGVIVWGVLVAQNPRASYNVFQPAAPEPTPTLILLPGINAPVEEPPALSEASEENSAVEAAAPLPTLIPTPTRVDIAPPSVQNTPSILPFTLENDAVTFVENNNGEGCAWQSIAGEVRGLQGQALTGLFVSVTADEFDFENIQRTGSEPRFGTAGYEVVISQTPIEAEYVVRLLNTNGVPLSEPIIVRTLPSCQRNVAVLNFIQNREF